MRQTVADCPAIGIVALTRQKADITLQNRERSFPKRLGLGFALRRKSEDSGNELGGDIVANLPVRDQHRSCARI
jgi:hypothetical protein